MSLDLSLNYQVTVPDGEDIWVSVSELWELNGSDCHHNITHNLGKMAAEANLYEPLWRPYKLFNMTDDDEYDAIILAEDILEHVEKGFEELKSNPKKYKSYNPDNGWGTYESLISFTQKWIKCLKKFPQARVMSSR